MTRLLGAAVLVGILCSCAADESMASPSCGEEGEDSSSMLQTGTELTGDNLVKVVNSVLTPLQAKLNNELPAAIQEAGYDPMEQVAEGTFKNGPTINIPLSPCKVKTSITYDITNLVGLDSVWISELVATKASTAGVTASATVDFAAQFRSTISADATLKAKGKVCGVPKTWDYQVNAQISGVAISFSAYAKVKTLSKTLTAGTVSDMQFSYQNFALSCSGNADDKCQSFSSAVSVIYRKSLEAQISMAIQDVINEKLAGITGGL